MKNKKPFAAKALIFFLAVLIATAATVQPAAARTIEQVFADPALKGTSISFVMQDLSTGRMLYERNADKVVIPASNMKLVTAASALLKLGAQHRFSTDFLLGRYDPASGAADGMYVVGYGDPSLSGDFFGSGDAAAQQLGAQIAAAGLRSLRGTLYLDDSYFGDNQRPGTWEAEDLSWCYAPRPGALAAGGNCLRVTASASCSGKVCTPVLALDPPVDPAFLKINVTVSAKSTKIGISQSADGVISIAGRVRSGGGEQELEYPVPHPALFYGAVLTGALKRNGVQVSVKLARAKSKPASYSLFYRYKSPLLTDILSEMLRHSDNFVAEQTLRCLGAASGRIGTHSVGAEEARNIMCQYNLAAPATLKVIDGSGLSRGNRLTARVLLGVLSSFYNSYLQREFMDLLARPGEDGTLEKRLAGTRAAGRIWAKTGALRGVCSLSGYILRNDGSVAAFSMLINGYSVHSSKIRALQDEIVLQMLDM